MCNAQFHSVVSNMQYSKRRQFPDVVLNVLRHSLHLSKKQHPRWRKGGENVNMQRRVVVLMWTRQRRKQEPRFALPKGLDRICGSGDGGLFVSCTRCAMNFISPPFHRCLLQHEETGKGPIYDGFGRWVHNHTCLVIEPLPWPQSMPNGCPSLGATE